LTFFIASEVLVQESAGWAELWDRAAEGEPGLTWPWVRAGHIQRRG